jgi:hypothetical protein
VQQAFLLGQSDNKFVASVLVGATIAPNVNFAISANVPSIFTFVAKFTLGIYIQVETPQGLIILINSEKLEMNISANETFDVQVLATVINGTMALESFVNNRGVNLLVTGDYTQGPPNVIQEILQYWHFSLQIPAGIDYW